jgi:hypothetical protein
MIKYAFSIIKRHFKDTKRNIKNKIIFVLLLIK